MVRISVGKQVIVMRQRSIIESIIVARMCSSIYCRAFHFPRMLNINERHELRGKQAMELQQPNVKDGGVV